MGVDTGPWLRPVQYARTARPEGERPDNCLNREEAVLAMSLRGADGQCVAATRQSRILHSPRLPRYARNDKVYNRVNHGSDKMCKKSEIEHPKSEIKWYFCARESRSNPLHSSNQF